MTNRRPAAAFLSIAVWFAFATTLLGETFPDDDLRRFPVCGHCRMDRARNAAARTLVIYSDGAVFAFCSIHCLALDLVLHTDKTPKAVMAADYGTKEPIDAETAFWVLGGLIKGVMAERGKWAFKSRGEAELFLERNGGELVSFERVLEASYHDMYNDSKAIRNRRKIKSLIKDFDKRSLYRLPVPSRANG